MQDCSYYSPSKRYQSTFKWLSKIFQDLIRFQESGGIVLDENGDRAWKLIVTKDVIKQSLFDDSLSSYIIIFGNGAWMDEVNTTKKWWKNRLSKWRMIKPEHVKKIQLGKENI